MPTPIKLLALDIDGVLTDNSILLLPNGEEAKRICFADLDAVTAAKREGLEVAFITGETGPMVHRIAARFGVERVTEGAKDKLAALSQLVHETGLPFDAICYVGDSDRDAPALAAAGLGVAPHTASPLARECADYVSSSIGVTPATAALSLILRSNARLSVACDVVAQVLGSEQPELNENCVLLAQAISRKCLTWVVGEPAFAASMMEAAITETKGLARDGFSQPLVAMGLQPVMGDESIVRLRLMHTCGPRDTLLYLSESANEAKLRTTAWHDGQTIIAVTGHRALETDIADLRAATPEARIAAEWGALWRGAVAVWKSKQP